MAKQDPVAAAWAKMEAWLAENAKDVLETLEPGAAEATLVKGEQGIGRKLPADVRASYRRHDGADYRSRPGQPVVSPSDGHVQRVSAPYKDDARYSGLLIRGSDGNAVNLWYVAPDAGVVGTDVAAGDRVGVAQDLRAKYGAAMTNHVHVRITNPGGGAIDPATLIPNP